MRDMKYVECLTVYKDCLVCGSGDYKVWAKDGPFTAVECTECTFVWMNPCPNEAGLANFYSTYRDTYHGLEELSEKRNHQYILDRDYIIRFLELSGKEKFTMLDVGCGAGAFLDTFDDRFCKYGTEIDGSAVKTAIDRFSDKVFYGKVQDFCCDEKKFDLIVMRGVIEHISDPYITMEKVSSLLKDDGLFYITATPNVDSFCAKIYREKWNQFIPVSHLLHFSDKTITRYLEKFGFSVIAKDFPYVDTPYANIKLDYEAMHDACISRHNKVDLDTSRAFWGNMMSVVSTKGTK